MQQITPIVIGGQTGCGKTLLLDKVNNMIDLEGLGIHGDFKALLNIDF
jgi:tRNA 2-selenouridine synthase